MPTPLASRPLDVLCLGEALVDLLPSVRGPLADVPSFERHPGGAPANVAIGVARLGGRSALVGTVGDDPFGIYLQRALGSEGVDVGGVRRTKEGKTGVAFVSLDERGAPRFFAPGAGQGAELAMSPADAAAAPIPQAKFLSFGTYLMSSPSALEATRVAVRRAQETGTLVAVDPNVRVHLWRDPSKLRVVVDEALSHATLVKLSSDECAFVTDEADPEGAARRLVARGVPFVVITCGAHGSVWARAVSGSVETGRVAVRAARVVDSTGAGDGFFAALLTGLSRRIAAGESPLTLERTRLERLLSLAGEAGARVCERVGAVAGLPSLEELGSLDV